MKQKDINSYEIQIDTGEGVQDISYHLSSPIKPRIQTVASAHSKLTKSDER